MAQVQYLVSRTEIRDFRLIYFTFRDDYDADYLLKSHRIRRQVGNFGKSHQTILSFFFFIFPIPNQSTSSSTAI